MNSDSNFPSGDRRSFVKKSLAASIIAVQPTLLAGLLRAQGGGGQTTYNPWETTDPYSTSGPETTNFWETTANETTTVQSTEEEKVLVCTESPKLVETAEDKNEARSVSGNHVVDPYKIGTLTLGFSGPKKGDFTADSFTLGITGNFNYAGTPVTGSVGQTVSRDDETVVFTDPSNVDIATGYHGGLEVHLNMEIENGRTTKLTNGATMSQQEVVNFPGVGWMTAEVGGVRVVMSGLGWSFTVMTKSAAEQFKAQQNQ